MQGKIGLEEHFAIDDTIEDSNGFLDPGIWPELSSVDAAIARQLKIEAHYAGYIERQDADILADNRAIKVNKGVAQIPDNARTKGVDGKQRHGDGAIAGALAVYATTLDPYQAPEYETVTAGRFEKRGVY